MDWIAAIIAGLVGTAAMTMLMAVAPMMGMPKMDIIGMLGSMFSANKGTATALGTIMHFMMGVVFAIIYALVWNLLSITPTWWWGLIFGAVHTLPVMVMMPVMMKMHPRPPAMERNILSIVGQFMGHMVFGLVVALVYLALA